MSEPTNNDRADFAQAALDTFMKATGSDSDTALRDLLADIMHWADREGFDFDTELRLASTHFQEEVLMARKHWTARDFVETSRETYSFPSGVQTWRHGYCRRCYSDMADRGDGLRHYHSHDSAKRAGIDWKAVIGASA